MDYEKRNEISDTVFENLHSEDEIAKTKMEGERKETEEKKRPGRMKLAINDLKNFCDSTTAHGLGRSSASHRIVGRLFWAILFLGMLAFVSRETYFLFLAFREKPISTKVTLKNEAALEFPVIVICNHNMIRQSKLLDVNNKLNGTWNGVTGAGNEITSAEILEVVRSASNEEKKEFGHLFPEFLSSCKWMEYADCHQSAQWYWKWFWDWKYGNCYSFNSGGIHDDNVFKSLLVQYPGPSNGLRLEFNLQQDEYIDNISPEAGVRIFIGARGKLASPYNEGFSLSPGKSYYIPIKKTVLNRVDPWGNGTCRSSGVLNSTLFSDISVYSINACRYQCLAKFQKKRCGCAVYWLSDTETKICKTADEEECRYLVDVDHATGQLPCENCTQPCREERYSHSISSTTYPSKKNRNKGYDSIKDVNYSDAADNVIIARFYYDQLDVVTIEESVLYGIAKFMADCGGMLGLWTGISCLTIIEFLIFIATCFMHMVTGRRIGRPR